MICNIEAFGTLFKLESALFHDVVVDLLVIQDIWVSQTTSSHFNIIFCSLFSDRIRKIKLSYFSE